MTWSLFGLLRRRFAPARRVVATLRKNPARRSRLQLEALEDRLVPAVSSIASSFNSTAIAPGSTIWFSSVLNPTNVGTNSITISVTNQTITFSDTMNGVTTPYTLNVPNAQITLSSSVTTATTTFNSALNQWVTTAPFGLPGNEFMSGYSMALPSGLHGGNNPVTWSGTFACDTPGVTLNWQWSAAVYSRFNASYSTLGVKPCDSNTASSYANSDHAGTPESAQLN